MSDGEDSESGSSGYIISDISSISSQAALEIRQRREQRRREEEEAAERVANDDSLDERAKIEALGEIRHWFSGDTKVIDTYLAGHATAEETAAAIAKPIDETYSSADHGVVYFQEERNSRFQRQYWSPDDALEKWGAEEEFPEPDAEALALPGTEVQLWDLWYAILHAAKRIPWTDQEQQEKLVNLVKALKARPNPPPPVPMTIPLKRNWIWENGNLWSELIMLGPSARETWNDCCGVGSGWTLPEQHAWTNVNAFVARLTASQTADFQFYLGPLRELDEPSADYVGHMNAPALTRLHVQLTVAAAWVIIAGDYIYTRRKRDGEGENDDQATSDSGRDEVSSRLHGTTTADWVRWRRRFEEESRNEKLASETRELSERCAGLIASFE